MPAAILLKFYHFSLIQGLSPLPHNLGLCCVVWMLHPHVINGQAWDLQLNTCAINEWHALLRMHCMSEPEEEKKSMQHETWMHRKYPAGNENTVCRRISKIIKRNWGRGPRVHCYSISPQHKVCYFSLIQHSALLSTCCSAPSCLCFSLFSCLAYSLTQSFSSVICSIPFHPLLIMPTHFRIMTQMKVLAAESKPCEQLLI